MREQIEKIEHAMREMDNLMWQLDEQGKRKEVKRVETILGKLYDLQYILESESK